MLVCRARRRKCPKYREKKASVVLQYPSASSLTLLTPPHAFLRWPFHTLPCVWVRFPEQMCHDQFMLRFPAYWGPELRHGLQKQRRIARQAREICAFAPPPSETHGIWFIQKKTQRHQKHKLRKGHSKSGPSTLLYCPMKEIAAFRVLH